MPQNPNLPSTILSIVLALEVPPFSSNINSVIYTQVSFLSLKMYMVWLSQIVLYETVHI